MNKIFLRGLMGKAAFSGIVTAFVFLSILGVVYAADGPALTVPSLEFKNGEVFVTSSLRLDEPGMNDLRNGISKEIVFYIDLFRVWPIWPDEFVLGKTITRTLKCDPVKKEFVATTLEGNTLTEKRFGNCEALMNWALNVSRTKLANLSELEPEGPKDPDTYFVRITAEGRLRRLPPVIGYLFFFVREKEFNISVDSVRFRAGALR